MQYSRGSAESVLVGLYTMCVRLKDGEITLAMEKDVLAQLGMDTEASPVETFKTWIDLVHPLYRDSIRSAVSSCIGGLQAEVRFLWDHPTIGVTKVSCTGVLLANDGEEATIKGFFKLSPYNAEEEKVLKDKDAAVYKLLLSDVIMNSYAVCALFDVESNQIFFMRDDIFPEVEQNKMSFEEWREFMLPMIFSEDADKFRYCTAQKTMTEIFNKNDNEFQMEVRYLNPSTNRYQRLKQRYLRFRNPIAGKYGGCLLFSEVEKNHSENFKESMRRRLIDGLALPYRELDLVNLKTGRFFSSKSRQGQYAESFDEIGMFDDTISQYLEDCDITPVERAECIDKFLVKNLLNRFSAGEKLLETELRHKRPSDGLYEWVRIQAFQSAADEDRKPYMAIVTVMPINDEKERQIHEKQLLEKALRSERQFRQAVQSNTMAVYTFNLSTDIMYEEIVEMDISAPLLPLLGLNTPCSYNEYVKRKSELFTVPEEAERFRKLFNRETLLDMFGSKRYTTDIEYEFAARDKTGVFRETVIMTRDFETGDIWGLTTIRSITEEREESKSIEQALRAAFNQAQTASNAKTQFMSQMSHDIRTPLNSIMGMTAIAREYVDKPERVQECLDKIEYAGHHLIEIINNVLDLSAIESGKMVLSEEHFSLVEFLNDLLKMFAPLTEKRHLSLNHDIEKMHDSVIGDPTKLRQLLVNIVSNAIKYTGDGGSIDFSARELEPDRHDVCRYQFTVTDDGIGMSEEFKKKMFDPFTRADDRRIGNAQGTGLGMSIALNLARMMNGGINVSSIEGSGTIVEVTICLKRGEETESRMQSAPAEKPKKVRMSDYDFGGRKVLLAEDLSFNAEIATEFLSQAGLSVDVACNGAEAVKMFSEAEPGYYSLIFMDIQMPVLDGHGAAREIRALSHPEAKTIPIIAMTANAFLDDIRAAEEAGMNGHISKPLEIPCIVSELVKYLGDCRRKADNT